MTLVLLAVGLLAFAAGLVTIGFGIPINAFSLGNTLIISGTITVASGLILIGLALVLGQLKRIALVLKNQPLVRPSRMAETAETAMPPAHRVTPATGPAAAWAAPEPQLPEPEAFEPSRVSEPHFPATANEPAPGPLDWLRAKSRPVTAPVPPGPPAAAVEPPMVELTDEAPLSPRPPQRPPMPPAAEPAQEPRVWSPSRDAGSPEPRMTPRSELPVARATPQAEPPREKERFDLVWPDRGGAPAPSEPKTEIKREPAFDMPLPPVPARPRETRVAMDKRSMPEPVRKTAPERGPAILKSGVIDGMPYTLYADGSIEAQLPQGMVKFASVDALRAHLEKQS